MSESDRHQSVLRDWIASATKDLTAAAARLAEEYEDHYTDTYAEALASGLSKDDAHAKAIVALGDPRASYLAAIPVRGDPHRLKVKAAIPIVGILLVTGSLYYKSTLMKLGDYGGYRLWKAIEAGDLEVMKEQLDAGVNPEAVDPNRVDQFGRSALYYTMYGDSRPAGHSMSLKRNRAALFDMLIEYGADIEVQESVRGWTPMVSASHSGDDVILEKLRSLGAYEDPESLIYQGRYEEVIEWAEREPDILTTTYAMGATIPQLLVSKGRLTEFKRALELGGDLHQLDDQSRSALHYAFLGRWGKSRNESIELVSYLLESGSDVSRKDMFDSTPLHYAASAWGRTTSRCCSTTGPILIFRIS